MSRRTYKENTPAIKAYNDAKQECRELLERLSKKVNDDPSRIHWGHVGDLAYIAQALRDTLNDDEA